MFQAHSFLNFKLDSLLLVGVTAEVVIVEGWYEKREGKKYV